MVGTGIGTEILSGIEIGLGIAIGTWSENSKIGIQMGVGIEIGIRPGRCNSDCDWSWI